MLPDQEIRLGVSMLGVTCGVRIVPNPVGGFKQISHPFLASPSELVKTYNVKVVISDFKSALPAWQVYHSVAQESQGKRLRAVEPWSRERCLATWPWSRRPRRRPCRGCGCRAAHGLQARTRGCLSPINLFRVHVNRNVTLCLLFMLRECPNVQC